MYTELVVTHLSYSRAMPEVLCNTLYCIFPFNVNIRTDSEDTSLKIFQEQVIIREFGAQSRGNSCLVHYITQCSCKL